MRQPSLQDDSLEALGRRVVCCQLCPRLVRWREDVARKKVRRYADQEYWGKPNPGFGDPAGRLLLVGLAPAAHGGNRTGRMFTGDESGRWLYRALYKAGFANQAESSGRSDGLLLRDCYITATCRCSPPANTLLPSEIRNCRPFLLRELELLRRVRVVVGLGRIGFEAALQAYRQLGRVGWERKPPFAHGARYTFGDLTFLASFHPSQQNTFTGRLTEPMLDWIFREAKKALPRGERK